MIIHIAENNMQEEHSQVNPYIRVSVGWKEGSSEASILDAGTFIKELIEEVNQGTVIPECVETLVIYRS